MQLSEIRDEVRLRVGLGTNDAVFPDTVLTSLINTALRQLTFKEDWPWLEVAGTVNTAAGTQTITIANRRKVQFLRLRDRELRYEPYRNLVNYYNLQGEPVAWTEYADTIYLLPTPDTIYTVDYGVIDDADTVLVNDTDEPAWPDRAIDILISWVCVLVARRRNDDRLEARFYGEHRQLYEAALKDIRLASFGEVPRSTRRW